MGGRQPEQPFWPLYSLKSAAGGAATAAHPFLAQKSVVTCMPPVEVPRNTVSSGSVRFGIPAHIYVCVTAVGSVILDLKRNRYLGLGREQTELLADAVAGWPAPPWQRSPCEERRARSAAERATCELLVADGVLERIQAGDV